MALTSASQGGYVASASTVLSSDWEPYDAFNTIAGEGEGWHDAGSTYSAGVYTGSNSVTPVTGGDVEGEWIQIQLPEKIKLEKVRLAPRETYDYRMPKDATILGSINGTDWYIVTSWSGQTYMTGNNYTTINVDSEQYYNYYVLVVEALGADAGGNSVNIGELEFWGIPEYDPEAHGTDVVVKSLPNVPNTDWLEVYYDGQDYTAMPTTVTDKSGNNRTGTPSGGVGFDTEYKAFTFNKTDNQYLSTSTSMSGNYVHSFSMWFKPNSLTAGSGDALFYIGDVTGSSNYKVELFMETDRINYTFGGNSFQAYPTIINGRWYHLAGTYNGAGGQSGREIYLNNVKLNATHSASTGVLNLPNNSNLDIGRYTPDGSATTSAFDGSIANFRLFNRALTSDEIYQLYAYQKEYFGHGDLGMTLKAGRLGIGTSEPRAMLDVRGGFQCGNSPLKFFVLTGVHPNPIAGQNVALPDGLVPSRLVSITGVTVNTNGDTVPFYRHDESTSWEVDVYYNIALNRFHLSSQGSGCPGKEWRMFVVTT